VLISGEKPDTFGIERAIAGVFSGVAELSGLSPSSATPGRKLSFFCKESYFFIDNILQIKL